MNTLSIVFTDKQTIDEMGQYRDWEYVQSIVVEIVDDYDRNGEPYWYVEDEGLFWNTNYQLLVF